MSIVNAQQEVEYRRNKFMASLQGYSLDEEQAEPPVDNIAKAMAEIEEQQGITSVETREEREFSGMGIAVVKGE